MNIKSLEMNDQMCQKTNVMSLVSFFFNDNFKPVIVVASECYGVWLTPAIKYIICNSYKKGVKLN